MMQNSQKRIRLCTCQLCLNLAFIWGNSLMPGEISDQISHLVGKILDGISRTAAAETDGGHHLLRKLAHFSEFACLGALLCWRVGMAGETGRHLAAMTLAGVLTAACVDETIQVFVADRGSSLIDVWIDTCGGAVGMIILLFGYHWIGRKHGN